MSELAIKVNIGGRVYPLKIERSEEEAIRKAAKSIEENIKTLQENYSVKDKQDLLAMTALQFATEGASGNGTVDNEKLATSLQSLLSFVEKVS